MFNGRPAPGTGAGRPTNSDRQQEMPRRLAMTSFMLTGLALYS